MKRDRRILYFIILIIHSFNIQGQKKFNIEIIVSPQIVLNKLGIEYDNGKKIIKVAPSFSNTKIVITDSFYSKYATLILTYPDTNNVFFNNRFFISDKQAVIEFLSNKNSPSKKNPLMSLKAINVIEIDRSIGAKKFASYAKLEFEDIKKFLSTHANEIGDNDSLKILFDIKAKKLNDKKLIFIKKNKKLYYSFWIFRTEIVPLLSYKPPDLLLQIFNTVFPNNLKKSIEGYEVKKILQGRAYAKNGFPAPDFRAKDFSGRDIYFGDLKGKYVLINFWASWCIPCIQHIFMIQEIYQKYKLEKFQVVSISYDTDISKFKDAIVKFQMDWINIYGDEDLINLYGRKTIPGLYLIDPNGKIISNNYENGDHDFFSILNNLSFFHHK